MQALGVEIATLDPNISELKAAELERIVNKLNAYTNDASQGLKFNDEKNSVTFVVDTTYSGYVSLDLQYLEHAYAMEYVAKEKLRDFYKESKLYADFSNKENLYRAMIFNVLQFVEQNKKMFRLASQSSNSNFFDSLHKIIYEELLDFLMSSQQNGETYRAPVDIFAMYLTGGLTSIVRWWLANDTGYTKEDMAKYIECMLLSSEKAEINL